MALSENGSVNGNGNGAPRALIEVSPALARRLRDPRVVAGWLLGAIGGLAVIAGYWGVSGTLDPGKQLPYIISGGIGGVFLLGLGATLVFSSDLAANRNELAELKEMLEDVTGQLADLQASLAPEPAPKTRKRATTG